MRRLFTIFALFTLASCAVLQVDVDVYKGPLASHDDVIPQRVAASTLGVQSDLIRLREHLKDSGTKELQDKESLAKYCKARTSGERTASFLDIDPYPHDLICEVDAVLGLFEDVNDREIAEFGEDATDALNRAADALSLFQRRGVPNPNAQRAREHQTKLAEKLWKIGQEFDAKDDAENANKANLARAYSCFLDNARNLEYCTKDASYMLLEGATVEQLSTDTLNPNYRLWRPIVWFGSRLNTQRDQPDLQIYRDYADVACKGERELAGGPSSCDAEHREQIRKKYGANTGFETIANRHMLNVHAKTLFPGMDRSIEAIRADFVDTVFQTSDGFRIARESYNTLMEIGLQTIIRIEEIKASADSGAAPDPNYTDYEQLSLLISQRLPELIQPAHVYRAACLQQSDAEAVRVSAQTIERLGFPSKLLRKCDALLPNGEVIDYQNVQDRIGWALQYWPRQTATDLMTLHNAYKLASADRMRNANVDDRHQLKNRREYGLIVGPDGTNFADQSDGFTFALSQVLSLKSQLAAQSIFSRGRLSTGVWTHVENYINASEALSRDTAMGYCKAQYPKCAAAMTERQARDSMYAALVRFSEKILGLANSAQEFATFQEERDEIKGRNDKERKQKKGREYFDVKLYEIVLQRIGNTTMAVADDLYSRNEYDRRQVLNRDREVSAIQAAFTGTPDTYYSAYRSNLDNEVTKLRNTRTAKAEVSGRDGAAIGKARTEFTEAHEACETLAADFQKHIKAIDGRDVTIVACKTDKADPSGAELYELNAPASVWQPRLETAKTILSDEDNPVTKAALAANVASGDNVIAAYAKLVASLQAFTATSGTEAEKKAAKTQADQIAELLGQARFKTAALSHISTKDLIASESSKFILNEGILNEVTLRLEAYEAYSKLAPSEAPMQIVEAARALVEAKQKALASAEKSNTASGDQFELAVSNLKHGEYALSLVDKLRPQVIDSLGGSQSESATPIAIKAAIISSVKTALIEEGFNVATLVEILDATQPAASITDLRALSDPKSPLRPNTSKEALDHLITSLRAEQIRIIREKGEDSDAAKYVEEALEAAYRQRADQIYIRPAISYLRTSYASSALGHNGVKWLNLLDSQAYRSLPILGGLIENAQEFGLNMNDRELLKIVENNDTQFWQNVNQVRVSGNGATNYVVTKDDIGNWYVRGYSADQSAISSSMKNLALYAAGTPGGLLTGAPADGSSDTRTAGPIERVFTSETDDYRAATKVFYDELQGNLAKTSSNKYAAAIITAWNANTVLTTKAENSTEAPIDKIKDLPADNVPALNAIAATMKADVENAAKRATDLKLNDEEKAAEIAQAQSAAIINGLRGLKTYHDSVAEDVAGKNLPSIANGAEGPGSIAIRKLAEAMAAEIQSAGEARQKSIEKLGQTAKTFSDAVVKASDGQ